MRKISAVGLLGLVAAWAQANPIVFSSPEPSRALQAGSLVEIRWEGVPADAEEMELLLSLDGGRHAALRLTDRISAAHSTYLWRVPNLSAANAALILRMGIDEEEVQSAPSAPFAIESEPFADAQALAWREGELWVADGSPNADPHQPLEPPDMTSSSQDRWLPASDQDHFADSPASPATAQAPRLRRDADRAPTKNGLDNEDPPPRVALPALRI